jgi:Xaa-Pro aminopeptidase
MSERVEKLRLRLDELGAATFLVSEPVNVTYLTGFESSNAAVLVGHDRVLVLTDGRYIEAARALGGEIEVVQSERDLAGWLGGRLAELAEPPVAFEANRLTYAAFEAIAGAGVELQPAEGVLERLRARKDASELDAIRRAAAANDAAFARIANEPFVGRTEEELAWAFQQALHEAGAAGLAFPTILASGPNAALPHHRPSERRIGVNETVIVDGGAVVDGYCSDCTRTFATGDLADDLRGAYAVCRRTQEEALARTRAGTNARELDAESRRGLERAGYEVAAGLGHGVGMEVHELPVLRPTAEGDLEPGHVVTVEPGAYLPGRGGVRIEDLVIVTDGEPEVLTPFTKELVTLD